MFVSPIEAHFGCGAGLGSGGVGDFDAVDATYH